VRVLGRRSRRPSTGAVLDSREHHNRRAQSSILPKLWTLKLLNSNPNCRRQMELPQLRRLRLRTEKSKTKHEKASCLAKLLLATKQVLHLQPLKCMLHKGNLKKLQSLFRKHQNRDLGLPNQTLNHRQEQTRKYRLVLQPQSRNLCLVLELQHLRHRLSALYQYSRPVHTV
jgi:hypothetical protein